MSRIDCEHVWKVYAGGTVGVRDLSFTCNNGEFLAILGPSGSGKSSTLRMLAGLEDITQGKILFDGRVVNDLSPAERNVALAFESYALYHRLSVYENIAFPLRARGFKDKDVDKAVRSIAETLDLTSILKKTPSELAGGHQQRVSLARALVRRPNVILLDEPLSHMDQRVRVDLRARIRRIHEDLKNTTIYVTHDQAEATALCDRLLILHGAELQQIGTVDEVWNSPTNKFVAQFVGEPGMNFVPGKIDAPGQVSIQTQDGRVAFEFSGEVAPEYIGREVTIGIRPQQIRLVPTEGHGTIAAMVRLLEFRGESTILTLELPDADRTRVKAVIPAGLKRHQGEKCWLEFPPTAIHLFNEEEKAIIRRRDATGSST